MGEAPALEAVGITKSYAATPAVESLSLTVRPGTVVGLLGRNGAGKTTVIRIFSTIVRPDSGDFWVAGVPASKPAQIRERLGVLPESAGYPSGQTGEEWLTYHARLFGRSAHVARSKARELLGEVGLADRGRSLVATYSRGMRQRLGIARSLVNDPEVAFLDEPTLGLDPSGQVQVLELVTGIARRRGTAVVITTHLLAEVERVCDLVVILDRGQIVAQGTVSEVCQRAAAPRRASLLVPVDQRSRALAVLTGRGIDAAPAETGHPGEVTMTLTGSATPDELSAQALSSLLTANIAVLQFTLEGGRLSDAFLEVTGPRAEGGRDV
jgi:ABC-2 type transport system ATP-binding protein